MPAISITGALGRKAGRSRGGLERFRNVAAGRLADGTAALADQEHDEIVAAVIMHAGDEGVAALDAVDEAVVAQKIERAVDRDRRRAPMPGEALDDLVGAERAVAVQQRLEHLAAHRGEPLRAGAHSARVRMRAGAASVVVGAKTDCGIVTSRQRRVMPAGARELQA